MYDPRLCVIINDTANKHWTTFTQPQDQYDFLYAVLWKMPFKRSSYIKKPKKKALTAEQKDDEAELKMIANNLCISVRELNEYKKQLDLIHSSSE
tara:strand:- start:6324 stop:6608 length:285 start_codon:yes stop_codon:yes gene_type:complete